MNRRMLCALITFAATTAVISASEAYGSSYGTGGYKTCGGWYASLEGFHGHAHDTLLSKLPFALEQGFGENGSGEGDETFNFFHINPDKAWGWRAAVGYDFPSCTCDNYGFSLEYTHFDHGDDGHVNKLNSEVIGDDEINPFIFPILSSADKEDSFFDVANAHLNTRYDTLDVLGHKNIVACNLQLQVFGGVRYLRIRENYDVHYGPTEFFFEGEGETEGFDDNVNFNNRFNGIGPRVGANMFYNVYCGFGVAGELAGSLLFGRNESDLNEAFLERSFDEEFESEGQFIHNHHHDNDWDYVVPGISGKVALAYKTCFCNNASLQVELGFRGDKYFNVIDNSALVQSLNIAQIVRQGQFFNCDAFLDKNATYHDFSIAGPYLAVTYHL